VEGKSTSFFPCFGLAHAGVLLIYPACPTVGHAWADFLGTFGWKFADPNSGQLNRWKTKTMSRISQQQPIMFCGHGAGPVFLVDLGGQESPFAMGDSNSLPAKGLKGLWERVYGEKKFESPRAIIVVSAHWDVEGEGGDPNFFEVLKRDSEDADLLFDYYGFPRETYSYRYNCPQDLALQDKVLGELSKHGLKGRVSKDRKKFDHGVFIPLLAIRPQADIPVLQISLNSKLDPEAHVKLGEALSRFSREGVLIIGSGMTVHNLGGERTFSKDDQFALPWAKTFQTWLDSFFVDVSKTPEQRHKAALEWETAPKARLAHPREEHFIPFLVTAAAAGFTRGIKLWETWMASSFPLNFYIWETKEERES